MIKISIARRKSGLQYWIHEEVREINIYGIDPLYGKCKLNNFIYELALTPEVQRLRDVRLSNINSLFLPGISNISRYEHSIGVALLAEKLSNMLKLDEIDKHHLIAAGILHDVATPPFGHTVESVFKQKDPNYSHEKNIGLILEGKTSREDSIYGGHTQVLYTQFKASRLISSKKIKGENLDPKVVASLIYGENTLGRFIKGDIDLDNIDNIYRMAYHMGIPINTSDTIAILEGYRLVGNQIAYIENNNQYIKKWLDVRKTLYSELMPNPFDCSAKTMISYGVSKAIDAKEINGRHDWSLTDIELIDKLSQKNSVAYDTIMRLRRGELFCIECMFWIEDKDVIDKIIDLKKRNEIENDLQSNFGKVILYYIYDKNKSSRNIKLNTLLSDTIDSKPEKVINLGESTDKLLLGIFSESKFDVSFKKEKEYRNYLIDTLGNIHFIKPEYSNKIGFSSAHLIQENLTSY